MSTINTTVTNGPDLHGRTVTVPAAPALPAAA